MQNYVFLFKYKYDFNNREYNRLIYTSEETCHKVKTGLSENGINE